MKSFNRYTGIDSYAVSQIRYQAQKLCRDYWCFSENDLEDIEQELMLDYLERISAFDPAKSSQRTFTSTIIKHKAMTLLEEACTEKRGGGFKPYLLSEALQHKEEVYLEVGTWKESPTGWEKHFHLEYDINRHIALLPERLSHICERLQTHTITEVSKETNIPKTTVYDAIARIRQHFIASGMLIYASSLRRMENASGK